MRSRKISSTLTPSSFTRRAVTRRKGKRSRLPFTLRLAAICFALLLYTACLLLLIASVDLKGNNQSFLVLTGHNELKHKRLERSRDPSTNPETVVSTHIKRDALREDFIEEALSVQRYLLFTTNRTALPLTAYVEPPLPLTNESNASSPLLPPRAHGPEALRRYTYNEVHGCLDLATNLPVDHSLKLMYKFGSNVGRAMVSLYPLRYDYAKSACPVDADPFLPWIHDVIPNLQGTHLEFVAHNKRRCRTGTKDFMEDIVNLEPQVTIMQSVPVKRLTEAEVRQAAPSELWSNTTDDNDVIKPPLRYRLSSLEDADPDARETRFICHFHTLKRQVERDGEVVGVERSVVGETLSVFPYNYEHANYRKPRSHPMLTRPTNGEDKRSVHNEQIWNSVLHIRCPIPRELQRSIRTGESVVRNVPTIYLDLVPIRTRPRETREGYFPQASKVSSFDPRREWGSTHVLPTVESSGRWANIPICPHPQMRKEHHSADRPKAEPNQKMDTLEDSDEHQESHTLTGCLWASATFATRGSTSPTDSSTQDRLLEWLTFHLYIANMDHIYVYDNSAAYSEQSSLAPVTDLFPSSRVTRVPWSHRVCNNNGPSHPNVGERSSQYAAEASCRLRYGSTTKWMVFFDTDEYLIPHGNWSDLKQWLTESAKSGGISKDTHILSFFQTRALPNVDYMQHHYGDANAAKCGRTLLESNCLAKKPDATFLEAYDCESTPLPKPDWGWRAKKQIYKPWFVLNHYVHYSTVTKRLIDSPVEVSPPFTEGSPYERRVDEVNEAFMLHAKTTTPLATRGWKAKCHESEITSDNNKCPVGIPWPSKNEQFEENVTSRADGMRFNCYSHERVKALARRLKHLLETLLEHHRKQSLHAR